ncbi:hypothetical protein V7S43_015229 [Phytophthora oleae]|uniref:Uncharacterized protein n=1 Tax=Phytophthora oleae TaxID=2107226 RepID=A0ABD3EZK9_9STRA
MVARILMLLAMDKCAMSSNGRLDDQLIGQLVPVKMFLTKLGVGEMPVYEKRGKKPSEIGRTAFYKWLLKWEGWYVGFTHFVQLAREPDEDTLWYLLGRRAAGVFPRDKDGADLLIPMFKRKLKGESNEKTENEKVSLMLVQVENWSSRDSEFPQSTTKELSPEFVFKAAENPLSKKTVADVIRIYMNVGDEASGLSRFIFASPLAENLPDSDSRSSVSSETGSDGSDAESWCGLTAHDTGKPQRSMGGAEEKASQVETAFMVCFRSVSCNTFPFLREDVAASLVSIVGSSWPLAALVDDDLDHRDREGDRLSSVMPRAELHEIALKGLAKAPGREQTTVKKCRKCLESSPDRKKVKRPQHK